jgi:hypothetical protein
VGAEALEATEEVVIFRRFEARFARKDDGEYGLGVSVYVSPVAREIGRTMTLRLHVGPLIGWIGWVVRRRRSPPRRKS